MEVSQGTHSSWVHGLWSLTPDQLQQRLLRSLQLQAATVFAPLSSLQMHAVETDWCNVRSSRPSVSS